MPMKLILMLACLVSLAGCAAQQARTGGRAQIVMLDLEELPLPAGINPEDDIRPYILGPTDKISISVFGEKTLDSPLIQIGGGGSIDVPIIGEIYAKGRTTAQLSNDIEASLKPILQRPQVIVNVVEALSQTALIDGAVSQPGLKPIIGKTSLQTLVANAGGVTENALISNVLILRTVDGKTIASTYNLRDIRRGQYGDPEIIAGDKIYIGDSTVRRLWKDVLSALPLLYLIAR